MSPSQNGTPIPRLGTLTGGFGRWVLIHKGEPDQYLTKTRPGDTIARPALPLEDVLPLLPALGYGSVSISAWLGQSAYPYSLSRRLRRAVPAMLEHLGLTLDGISAAGGSRHNFDRFGYATRDEDELAERIGFTEEVIRLAADWGAPNVQDIAGALPRGMDEKEAWERVVRRVDHLATFAGEHGVTYAIEPYMGIVNTADRYLRLREDVGGDRVACVIDPASMLAEDDTTIEAICSAVGRHAVAVHIKGITAQGRMTQPGGPDDTFDLVGLWQLLQAEGYDGALTLEEYPDSYPEPRDPIASAAAAAEAIGRRFRALSLAGAR